MLINFSVSNYKSYKTPQTLTMIPGRYRSKANHVIRKKDLNVLKFTSVYGGNASGKSNLVDAVQLTKTIIDRGVLLKIEKDLHFKLDTIMNGTPSNFEYKILAGDKIFIYGLSLSFDNQKIINEYLFESKNKNDILVYDFDYENDIFEFNYNNISDSDNRKKIDVYIDDFSHNTNKIFLSFIKSIKFQSNEQWIKNIHSVHSWFKSTLTVLTPESKPLDIVGLFDETNDDSLISVIDLIKSFDTGISDFLIESLTIDEFVKKIKAIVPIDSHEEIQSLFDQISDLDIGVVANIVIADQYFKASRNEEDISIQSIKFEHCNTTCAEFEISEESDGTRRIIELVNILYSIQFKNRVFIVDELNRSLHSNLTVDFIEKFIELSEQTESQLIVTNHDSALMDLNIVRQDEIWIVDRDPSGSSNLISLSKYSIRSDKVLNKDYLFGRYGGIPQIYKLLPKD